MSKTFFFKKQNQDEWLEKSSKLNKEVFNLLKDNKHKGKNFIVMIREIEDKELAELLTYYK